MKLRARLALTTLGVALPLIAAVALGLRGVVQRASDDLVAAAVLARVGPELRAECERGATRRLSLTLPRHAGARLIGRNPNETVNVELVSRSGSPGVPESLVASIARGDTVAARTVNGERQLLVALPWEAGPCAAAFARARPAEPPLFAPPVVIPIVLALVAILVGVGPIVRRILSLTAAVRRFRGDTAQVPAPATEKDELGELSRAFHEAARSVREQHAELTSRERDLREFVENTSHDLATPLTVLQGHLAALERGHDPLVVRQAMNEAHYLGSLLGSLALTAKLDAGARLEVTLDLDELVTRVVDRHRGLAERNAVMLEYATGEDALLVTADP